MPSSAASLSATDTPARDSHHFQLPLTTREDDSAGIIMQKIVGGAERAAHAHTIGRAVCLCSVPSVKTFSETKDLLMCANNTKQHTHTCSNRNAVMAIVVFVDGVKV